ncbi:mucoidy inhibitor MuiA family protein [Flavobacteriaceae bacterium TP-CH-4]|uniref:Mucoidy inhibitor MuiA family protein n=1 Tax=Pelagihabitans pacificus TaxID=2696054 RepID=A0A967AVA6_9FLAO|nr:mucoidy inhibitor MuiA family protein [Pelagihabitans pacificus]NHF60035.1 mucoidy inhibitor MuiA family protein [Pelagihabitans pacificus]
MKNLLQILTLCPFLLLGNFDPKLPSTVKEVTVYLNGAQVTRTAICNIKAGTSNITLTGLSTKIDESSIQLSGLQSVSILSMDYDINYLSALENPEEVQPLQRRIDEMQTQIALLNNTISGLEEEEQVIYANRSVGTRLQNLSLEKVKEISTYYRERITAIKNAIFDANTQINDLNENIRTIQKQLAELNKTPEKEQGELTLKLDAPIATSLRLTISYQVSDAGWIPNYEIKSNDIDQPLLLAYKAHVYQKSGVDWNNVKITLSTGNPKSNLAKPHLGTKYLNFTNGYTHRRPVAIQKQKYVYNPSVKKITGVVTDESGLALPGANVRVKGTSAGTQTDFDGYFSLEAKNGSSLVFSYLGYHDQEIPIYASMMNVRMQQDATALEEVIVTGQGTRREKRALGYAVSSVESEDISRTLNGRAAGISIRGTNTVRGGSIKTAPRSPLYVIDGVPVDDFVEGDLDESEIQSVEVLKGANATSVYGTRGANGVIIITTKKSTARDGLNRTDFEIKKSYTIVSDADITAIEINTFQLQAAYSYFTAPLVNENVFLTATFSNWEQYNLLPGEASIYFKGGYSGKTTLDPYTTKAEMVVSLGIDPNITVTRTQNKNFKSRSFTGSNRIVNRTYDLEVKNNKNRSIELKLLDRIPISQNKDIKVDDIVTNDALHDIKKGLLTWKISLPPLESITKSFSFQVKYPRYRSISL